MSLPKNRNTQEDFDHKDVDPNAETQWDGVTPAIYVRQSQKQGAVMMAPSDLLVKIAERFQLTPYFGGKSTPHNIL
jgi:hypothetical protein